MTNGNGCVANGFSLLHKEVGNGLPNDVTPSDNQNIRSINRNPSFGKQILDAVGSAGYKAGLTDDKLPHIHRMEAVYILQRVDGVKNLSFVDVLR